MPLASKEGDQKQSASRRKLYSQLNQAPNRRQRGLFGQNILGSSVMDQTQPRPFEPCEPIQQSRRATHPVLNNNHPEWTLRQAESIFDSENELPPH